MSCITPIAHTPTAPLAQAGLLKERFEAAHTRLQNNDFLNCYSFLKTIIKSHADELASAPDSVQRFFALTRQLQIALFHTHDYAQLQSFICGAQEAFVQLLIPISAYQYEVLSILQEGINQLRSVESLKALELKIEYLQEAIKLTRETTPVLADQFLVKLGETRLQIAAHLPLESCFEMGYFQAAVCFNLAKNPSHNLMTAVEQGYLKRVMGCENSIQWAKAFLWTSKSTKGAQLVIDLAERQLDDRQLSQSCAFYSLVVDYARKYPIPDRDKVNQRHIQLGMLTAIDSQRPYGWERNREALHSIRSYTRCLYLRHLENRVPEQQPQLPLAYQRCFTQLAIPDGKVLSIFDIQDIHCALMTEFVNQLYTQAIAFMGLPPKGCKYCLVGLGSFARKEMGFYSDLDAILIVHKLDDEIRKYFERVGRYFDLLVLNLGETHQKEFLGVPLGKAGFHLDTAGLHPRETIETSDELVKRQSDWWEETFKKLHDRRDIDPLINAQQLPCFLSGEKELFENYVEKLRKYHQSSAGKRGTYLLTKWEPPPIIDGQALHVKKGLYRPITLLIDALGAQHNISAIPTHECLQALKGKMPDSFLNLCERALELACRLRLSAQVHYEEAREDVYFHPDPHLKSPLLLSYDDKQTLEEIEVLLFEPLRLMDLSQGIDFQALRRARLAYIERLIDEDRMERAAAHLREIPHAPSSLRLPIAYWQGDFQQTVELNEQERPSDETFYDSVNPYRQAFEALKPLPSIPSLNSLAGKLSWLKTHSRKIPADPSQTLSHALFWGDTRARRRNLWIILTKLALSARGNQLAWNYAHQCFHGKTPLLYNIQELIAAILPLPLQEPTLTDLVYVDLIEDLRQVLALTKDSEVYTYLFHRFPMEMQKRFLQELQSAQISPVLCDQFAHFPCADGSRPLLVNQDDHLNFQPLEGFSEFTSIGIDTNEITLSPAACEFVEELLNGKKGQYGRHPSGRIGDLWLKLEPEFPGREFAVLTLQKFVTGSAFPMRELLKVTRNKKSFALNASLYVPGPNLQDVLEIEVLNEKSQIENLDFRKYCFDVLMTLLILPEDDKADNFIIYQPTPNCPVQLINVDADRAFFPALKKNWGIFTAIQCKSILLCLDQMKLPIDHTVRDEFLALEPANFFEQWLKQIDGYNQACVNLFGEPAIDERLVRPGQDYAELPFYLEPTEFAEDGSVKKTGILLTLIQRFKVLQRELSASPNTTLVNLLLKVHEKLGALYNTELQKDKRAIDRFNDLTPSEYSRKPGSSVSVTTSQLRGPYKKHGEYEVNGWTGQGALQNLKRVIVQTTSVQAMREDLLNRNGAILHILKLPRLSAQTLKAIDFSRLHEEEQRRVIANITGLEFEELVLHHCRVLSDPRLKAILQHCPNLTLLDLSHSTGVRELTYLNTKAATLETLKLNSISTLKNLSWDSLIQSRRLVLPALKVLDISHSPLTRIELVAPSLKGLFNLSAALPANFSLKCRSLEVLAVNNLRIAKELIYGDLPAILHLGSATICRMDLMDLTMDLTLIMDITSIEFHDRCYTIFRQGPLCEAETAALELGYRRFTIETPTTQSKIFVRDWHLFTRRVEFEHFLMLLDRCHNLTNIDYSKCIGLNIHEIIQDVVERCTRLTSLNLSGCKQIIDKGIRAIAERCTGLTSLNITGCNQLTEAGIGEIAKGCPNLAYLNLTGCQQLSDAGIRAVAERCMGLRSLNVTNCYKLTNAGIWAVAKRCTILSSLDVTGCWKLTHEGIRAVAEECTRLNSLNLSECHELTDAGIRAVTEPCKELTSLNLSGCDKLADAGIQAVAQHCTGLTSLNLSRCCKLTDEGIGAVAKRCTRLTSLNLSGCVKLADAGIRAVAKHCTGLTSLNLSRCCKLTNEGIGAVAKRCTRLTSLELLRCDQLTNGGILAVAKRCTRLTSLDLSDCSKLTVEEVEVVRMLLPEARVYTAGISSRINQNEGYIGSAWF